MRKRQNRFGFPWEEWEKLFSGFISPHVARRAHVSPPLLGPAPCLLPGLSSWAPLGSSSLSSHPPKSYASPRLTPRDASSSVSLHSVQQRRVLPGLPAPCLCPGMCPPSPLFLLSLAIPTPCFWSWFSTFSGQKVPEGRTKGYTYLCFLLWLVLDVQEVVFEWTVILVAKRPSTSKKTLGTVFRTTVWRHFCNNLKQESHRSRFILFQHIPLHIMNPVKFLSLSFNIRDNSYAKQRGMGNRNEDCFKSSIRTS